MIKDAFGKLGLTRYRRRGDLPGRKLWEYIPAMFITNLSTLLLASVDGIVAGNLVGSDALSSINIFYPVLVVVGALSVLTGSGIATSLSTAMGRNDAAALDHIKGVSLRIVIIMAVAAGIVQIPVVWLVVRSYGLPDEIFHMTMQYAAGMMICTPLGLISSAGTYELQIAGKMKALMALSVIEGVANLIFDVLYTGVFDMGIAGTGFGTASANLIRCTLTVIYLHRCTDMLRSDTKKVSASDVKSILGPGVPDASYSLMFALQSYLMMKMILIAFGTDGGVIMGVCMLCLNITNVFITGITGSMRPLMGLYAGADDKAGLNILMRQGKMLNILSAGLATLVIELHPEWFYAINGVHDIPEGGVLSVRLYSICLMVKGFVYLLRLYLSNRKDSKYATLLTVVGNATLPVFAFILWKSSPAPFIFLAYPVTETVVFVMSYIRYRIWRQRDRDELEKNGEDIVLYMSVKPKEAVEASKELMSFAEERGISERTAYLAALCMEEMVVYAVKAEAIYPIISKFEGSEAQKKIDALLTLGGTAPWTEDLMTELGTRLSVEIMVRFRGKDEAVFVELDDGRCIMLDKNESTQKLITDNYGLLKKLADSIEYQYVLNLNYTRFTFDNGRRQNEETAVIDNTGV